MGRIKERHEKRKRQNRENPIGEFGNRNEQTNQVDFDEETIKDQEKKLP